MSAESERLLDLMFGAKDRYRTARATEAERRYVEYGFSHGILFNFDPPFDVPRYREYEDLDEVSRLWHERPDRWRQETFPADRSETTYRVVDGEGEWWCYGGQGRALYSPTNHGEFSPDEELSSLLDPYEIRWSLGDCDLLLAGHAQSLGRDTLEVEAKAVSWNYAPSGPFWEGADDYLLSVDARLGVLLRLASRLRGEEFDVFEIVELAFDESFPEGTFSLELPGVEFQRIDPTL
ncbi:MAG TPA: hypothetical protein VF068_06970 [Rubrobacter sp.]